MAAAPSSRLVAADEYLNTSYRPDVEYVDGALVERSMPTIAHAFLQLLLGSYLRSFRSQFQFAVLSEVRTQIKERTRYRLPDLAICPLPLPKGRILKAAPWVVAEILSPGDGLPEMLDRFRDYEQIGVRHILLLDPDNLLAYRYEGGSLLEGRLTSLDLPTGQLPFDTEDLFRQLTAELNEGRA